jgi:hypothetical protein
MAASSDEPRKLSRRERRRLERTGPTAGTSDEPAVEGAADDEEVISLYLIEAHLERLEGLYENGLITEDEYRLLRARILNS